MFDGLNKQIATGGGSAFGGTNEAVEIPLAAPMRQAPHSQLQLTHIRSQVRKAAAGHSRLHSSNEQEKGAAQVTLTMLAEVDAAAREKLPSCACKGLLAGGFNAQARPIRWNATCRRADWAGGEHQSLRAHW